MSLKRRLVVVFLCSLGALLTVGTSVEAWNPTQRLPSRARLRFSLKIPPEIHRPEGRSHSSFSSRYWKPLETTSQNNANDGSLRRRRPRKRWLLLALVAMIAVFVPARSASAASRLGSVFGAQEAVHHAAAAATEATAQFGSEAVHQAAASGAMAGMTYHTNPAVSFMSVGSPVSRTAELRLTLRLVFAAVAGGTVGKERSGSSHHKAAGVRTMALVSLGAAAFTICSMYGFTVAGRYDPSRMASNVASGVGFVGAGVITTTSSRHGKQQESIVHGLTTAAAIWLSAAIGVASGVGMFYLATAATLSTVSILRFGRVAKKIQKKQSKKKGKRRSPNGAREMNGDSIVEEVEEQIVYRQERTKDGWNETQFEYVDEDRSLKP